jgi:hypothetical protein
MRRDNAKRTFFAKASPAGAAFDYLEDKARVSVLFWTYLMLLPRRRSPETIERKMLQAIKASTTFSAAETKLHIAANFFLETTKAIVFKLMLKPWRFGGLRSLT